MSAIAELDLSSRLSPEAQNARLNEVVKAFGRKIDVFPYQKEQRGVLFEGDYNLATNQGEIHQVKIGKGIVVDFPDLNTRFIKEISDRASIISSVSMKNKEPIRGENDALLYFKSKFPNNIFPIDRTAFNVVTNDYSNLIFFSEIIYANEGNNIPIALRWLVKNNNLFSPSK